MGRIAMYSIFFVMAATIAIEILSGLGIVGIPSSPIDLDQVYDTTNPDDVLDSWDYVDKVFYDIGSGIGFFWNANLPIIEAFPEFLTKFGAPTNFVNAFKVYWRYIWLGTITGLILGKDITP